MVLQQFRDADANLYESLGTEAFVSEVKDAIKKATWAEPSAFTQYLPLSVLRAVFSQALTAVSNDEPVVHLEGKEALDVVVVGDTHGQVHDTFNILDQFYPSDNLAIVFNGDLADRGNFGIENIVLILSLKLAFPRRVFILRGNHETSNLQAAYGLADELIAKVGSNEVNGAYGRAAGIWQQFLNVCCALPVVFVVKPRPSSATAAAREGVCVVHGGLPRHGSKKRKHGKPVVPTLQDIASAALGCLGGGEDPIGPPKSVRIVSDCLWSDPCAEDGMHANEDRQLGCLFGPDASEAFLEQEGLGLLVRSHEGPEARFNRKEASDGTDPLGCDLEDFTGYAIDHRFQGSNSPSCVTVFSAPLYPQHAPEFHVPRAAVLYLQGNVYASSHIPVYLTPVPRPSGAPFYNTEQQGSDLKGPGVEERGEEVNST